MPEQRRVRLGLGSFGLEALAETASQHHLTLTGFVAQAARRHVARPESRPLPSFLAETPSDGALDVALTLEPSEWRALEAEAAGTGVDVERVCAHATLTMVAELDSVAPVS